LADDGSSDDARAIWPTTGCTVGSVLECERGRAELRCWTWRLIRELLGVVFEVTVVFGELACWWGGLMGLVGLGVSKMEGIKASVVWVSSRTQAMSWCFRCVSAVFSACFGVALHGARADRLRFGHLASSMRRAGARV